MTDENLGGLIPERMTRGAIWTLADQYRDTCWPELTVPIDVLKIVEFRTPLRLEPRLGLVDSHGVEAFLRTDLTGLVIDQERLMDDRFHNRMRFSISHELGHWVMHTQIIQQQNILSGGLYNWKHAVAQMSVSDYHWFEWQANEFAGRFLVPTVALSAVMKNPVIQTAIGFAQANGLDTDATRSYVSSMIGPDYFGVSGKVVETRLRIENLY